jgi:histidyl-tRNA synthetase
MIQKPKGTRDFSPSEILMRRKVFDSLKTVAERFGFKEVQTPVIESVELLTKKSGDEIKEQLFLLEQKGKEQLALRPEMTPSVTRLFIENQKSIQKPVKWYYFANMFRYEAPQKGRLREFYQFGVELFGSDKIESDAEIIVLAIELLKSLGLTEKDFKVKINNRKLLQGLLIDLKIKNKEEVLRIIDKSKKITEKELKEEFKKLKLSDKQIKDLKKIVDSKIDKKSLNDEALFGLEQLEKTISLLKPYSKYIEMDLTIARGLAYYTDMVFEIMDKKEELRAIAGGGRYDNLIEIYSETPCPAVGFAIGDVTLFLLLEKAKKLPKIDDSVDYYVATIGDVKEKALKIVQKLREKYSVEMDLMDRNLSKQLKYANAINAKKLIVIGENEIKTKKVKIKDMKTGKETTKDLNSI